MTQIENPIREHRLGGRRCEAKKRNSTEQCGGIAIRGTWLCKNHSGKSPAQIKEAQAAEDRRRAAVTLRDALVANGAVTPDEDPLTALKEQALFDKAWLEAIKQLATELKVEEMRYRTAGGEQLRSEITLLERAMDRRTATLEKIARLNIDERLARIEEAKVAMVVAVLQRSVREFGLDPSTPEVMRVVRANLLAVESEQSKGRL